MNQRMGVQAVFVVLLMFAATVKADVDDKPGEASFWRKTVTLTCPENGTWFDKENKPLDMFGTNKIVSFEYKQKVEYSCKYSDTESDKDKKYLYLFYVRGVVCDNCFELEGVFFLVIILADVIGSTILMIIIYKFNKKKRSDEPSRPAKAPAKPGGRAPPVPNPDYEPLNPNTRSADTYSTVVNRMG